MTTTRKTQRDARDFASDSTDVPSKERESPWMNICPRVSSTRNGAQSSVCPIAAKNDPFVWSKDGGVSHHPFTVTEMVLFSRCPFPSCLICWEWRGSSSRHPRADHHQVSTSGTPKPPTSPRGGTGLANRKGNGGWCHRTELHMQTGTLLPRTPLPAFTTRGPGDPGARGPGGSPRVAIDSLFKGLQGADTV